MKPHKLPFLNDYMYACHPQILKQMAALADKPHTGYGCDELCEAAREKIRQACQCPEAGVHFLIGGTATNVTAIDALIRSYQGVLATPLRPGPWSRPGIKFFLSDPSKGR